MRGEEREAKMFVHATNDPQTKDAKEALTLIHYLEERNARLIALENKSIKSSFGEWLSDSISAFGGSWTFILIFIAVLGSWVLLNITAFFGAWDPFPFILLNLCLSTIAALQAPIILMSQNRQAQRDRLRSEIDLERDRLDLEVDTFAAKVTHDALLKVKELDEKLDKIAQSQQRMEKQLSKRNKHGR
jgi:uncharacterized membrane protein